ncbi:MAG: C-terminal binding protein [Sphingomonadaceae bacterium]|nr:C-terminal binding protein [Sphingomonadaceae bacterium]
MAAVLVTDYAWPDLEIEQAILAAAGHELKAGPGPAPSAEAVAALAAACDPAAIMTCWANVRAPAIDACSELRIIARLGVGLDNIDLAAAGRVGAVVTNVPDYCVEEVSDHAVALLLAHYRGIALFDRSTKRGLWEPAAARLTRMRDLAVGLFGFGRIAGRTAEKLMPLVGRVLATRRSASPLPEGVEGCALDSLLAQSDAVIIHAPLTGETHGLFDAHLFARMKEGALLINVSRGQIVDNDALLKAIEHGRLSGAGLDVIEGEPDPPEALLAHPAIVATPHIAFSSAASLAELRRRACEDVVRVLAGEQARHSCALS